jgi:2'-5' RNA ligase
VAKRSRSRGGEPAGRGSREGRGSPAGRGSREGRGSAAGRGSRERPGSPRARLFLALEPTGSDREALARWRDAAVAGRDDLRPVAADALHLTLVFLGYRPEKEIERIAEAAFAPIQGAAGATLEPRALKAIPPRSPRLFALDLADPGGRAAEIQAAASEALDRARFYEPEKRPWWPHITIARVKRHARAAPLGAEPPTATIVADTVTLYRSLLSPRGARYEPLARIRLVR